MGVLGPECKTRWDWGTKVNLIYLHPSPMPGIGWQPQRCSNLHLVAVSGPKGSFQQPEFAWSQGHSFLPMNVPYAGSPTPTMKFPIPTQSSGEGSTGLWLIYAERQKEPAVWSNIQPTEICHCNDYSGKVCRKYFRYNERCALKLMYFLCRHVHTNSALSLRVQYLLTLFKIPWTQVPSII